MRHRLSLLYAALVTFVLAPSARAADETVALRWKFEAGKIAYVVQDQQMSMTTATGPEKTAQKQSQTVNGVLEMKLKAEPMTMPRSVDFDVENGHIRAVRLAAMKSKMSGTMVIKLGEKDEPINTDMTMEMEGKMSLRYQSEKPK